MTLFYGFGISYAYPIIKLLHLETCHSDVSHSFGHELKHANEIVVYRAGSYLYQLTMEISAYYSTNPSVLSYNLIKKAFSRQWRPGGSPHGPAGTHTHRPTDVFRGDGWRRAKRVTFLQHYSASSTSLVHAVLIRSLVWRRLSV